MTPDPVLDEIRETRESIGRSCNFNPAKIGEYILHRQEEFRAAGAIICEDAGAYAAGLTVPQKTPDYPFEVSEPDPILAEIRAARDEIARECNYDVKVMAARARQCVESLRAQGWRTGSGEEQREALVREEPPVNPRGDTAGQP